MAQDELFSNNLLRMIAAELHVANLATASRELFGRGYFSLSEKERQAVDGMVTQSMFQFYNSVMPEALAAPKPPAEPLPVSQPIGFHAMPPAQNPRG